MDDEPDIIVELIDLYLDDVPRRLALMRSAICEEDQSAIKQQAHALKGSSGNLGAVGMTLICGQMERLAFDSTISGLPLIMDQVEQEFSRVKVIFLEERHRRLA